MKIKSLNRITRELHKKCPIDLEKYLNGFLQSVGSSLAVAPNGVAFFYVCGKVVLKVEKNAAGKLIHAEWMSTKTYKEGLKNFDAVLEMKE